MRPFLKHKSFFFKKMLFTESSETNIGNFHSMFLVFAVYGAFFDKLLSLHREIEKASSSSYREISSQYRAG